MKGDGEHTRLVVVGNPNMFLAVEAPHSSELFVALALDIVVSLPSCSDMVRPVAMLASVTGIVHAGIVACIRNKYSCNALLMHVPATVYPAHRKQSAVSQRPKQQPLNVQCTCIRPRGSGLMWKLTGTYVHTLASGSFACALGTSSAVCLYESTCVLATPSVERHSAAATAS